MLANLYALEEAHRLTSTVRKTKSRIHIYTYKFEMSKFQARPGLDPSKGMGQSTR